MQIKPYDSTMAVKYAHKWAYDRNPIYYNFDSLGGDCTAFVSQCIYDGSNIMNYGKLNSWYYNNINDRSPSWSGVEFIYKFLVNNKSVGPFGIEVQANEAMPGDIVQLSFDGNKFEHSVLIVETINSNNLDTIKIAAHTNDADYRKISTYDFNKIRFMHIQGVRTW